jgi:hypothetical protein
VVNEIKSWTKDTPLFHSTGESSTDTSYANICAEVDRLSLSYEHHYEATVVNSAVQWEEHVTNELTTHLLDGKNACQQLEHYERKVESLRSNHAKFAAKDYKQAAAFAEKLQRNEEKLAESIRKQKECEQKLRRCDEVIGASWMSLHPLLVQLFDSDVRNATEMANVKLGLRSVLDGMSKVAEQHGISLDTSNVVERWCHLSTLGPSNLSARPLASSLDGDATTGSGGDSPVTFVDDFHSVFPSREALDFSPSVKDNGIPDSSSYSNNNEPPIRKNKAVPDFSSEYEGDAFFSAEADIVVPADLSPSEEVAAFFPADFAPGEEADAFFPTDFAPSDEADAFFPAAEDDLQPDIFCSVCEVPEDEIDLSPGFESPRLEDVPVGGRMFDK